MFASKEEIRLNMVELVVKSIPSDRISADRIINDAEKLSDYIINGPTKSNCHGLSPYSSTGSTVQDNNHVGLTLVFGCRPQHKQS